VHKDILERLLERPLDSHKYKYGHVLVVGGSPGMVGAPLLAGMAALRTGAGLVTIAAGGKVAGKLEERVKEIMTLELPSDGADAAARIEGFALERKVSVIVAGPGMAVTPEARTLVEHLLDGIRLPLIVDGGALGILRGHVDRLDSSASKALVLTPHAGEFQRLADAELPGERSELRDMAAEFAEDHDVTLVLKGNPTYVARPTGSVYENTTGNPGLATAGTGDVLSGVIAGIIAQGIGPQEAAETGVYLHGLAGDIASAEKTQPGVIAGDVIEAIPAALKHIAGEDTA
jgi:ADP-dependent NAD(P)H-hydrate dehydratase / NAD(P)H-hydrate epimerase